MGELKIGDFGRKLAQEKIPKSPFKETLTKGDFRSESLFSKNGVVEYKKGRKPRNDEEVPRLVSLWVGPMKRTILTLFPELEKAPIDLAAQAIVSDLTLLDLVEETGNSTLEDWKHDPVLYLELIRKIEERGLDVSED